MRVAITIRRRGPDFTIPGWAFSLVSLGGERRALRRLTEAVRERLTRRRRLTTRS
jgi:hypothetical protein